MDWKLHASKKEGSINLLITREDPDISKVGQIGKDSTGNFAVHCLGNITMAHDQSLPDHSTSDTHDGT